MCTLLVSVAPGGSWDVLLASTRDEFRSRAWEPPGEWWPETYPGAVGGRDLEAGGSWLAVEPRRRRVAVVLNRIEPSAVADAQAESRGELPLLAVSEGAEAVGARDLRRTRPFNLLSVEGGEAVWWRWDGDSLSRKVVPPGLHILTAADLDDMSNPRQRYWLPEFAAAVAPEPSPEGEAPDGWGGWPQLLADVDTPFDDPRALNVRHRSDVPDFGTVCASLVALGDQRLRFDFCPGPPDEADWVRVL